MRVLITGAAGFVGRWLARELLAGGDRLFGLHRPGDGCISEGTTPLEADIRDPEALARAVATADPRRSTIWPRSPRRRSATLTPSRR